MRGADNVALGSIMSSFADKKKVINLWENRAAEVDLIPTSFYPDPPSGTSHPPPGTRHPAPGTGHPPPGTRGRATAHVRPVVEISLSSTMEIINEKMNAIISIVCPSGTGISNRSIRVVGAETWEVTLESIEGNPSTVPETSKQRQQQWTNRHK